MHNHKQVLIPIDEIHDLSIINYDTPSPRGYGMNPRWEVAICGEEITNVTQISNVKDLKDFVNKYF